MDDENRIITSAQNPFATINETNVPKNLLSYDGRLGFLFAIYIKNFFLTIITLGIYSSWARNNIRKYTFGSFSIGGDRLEYSGKGGQLFKGAVIIAIGFIVLSYAFEVLISTAFPAEYAELVKADEGDAEKTEEDYNKLFGEISEPETAESYIPPAPPIEPELQAVLLPNGNFDINGCVEKNSADECERLYILNEIRLSNPVVVPEIAANDVVIPYEAEQELSTTAQILLGSQYVIGILGLLVFSYFAKFSASRYRLVNAKWRRISGGIAGISAVGYISLRLKRLILNIVSLGLLIGRSDLIANKYLLNGCYIGKTKFNFEPNLRKLDKVNFITLILAIPTLGISRIWYKASLLNHKYESLSLGGIKFSSTFSGGKLMWLSLSNFVIVAATLFIGTPIAMQRSMKFFAENVRVMGNADNLSFIQQQFNSDTLGEGLNQVLDLPEGGIDFGVI